MTNIMSSILCNQLVGWLPVGFKKSDSSPNNNVGIIPFCFTRGMTIAELANILENLKHLCIGSRELLIESYKKSAQQTVETESLIKSKIDVVLTLANILHEDDNNVGASVTAANGGMYYKMNSNRGYPFYIWGMVMNGIAHITYSVNDKACDIGKLIVSTNADDVTNQNAFSVNLPLLVKVDDQNLRPVGETIFPLPQPRLRRRRRAGGTSSESGDPPRIEPPPPPPAS